MAVPQGARHMNRKRGEAGSLFMSEDAEILRAAAHLILGVGSLGVVLFFVGIEAVERRRARLARTRTSLSNANLARALMRPPL